MIRLFDEYPDKVDDIYDQLLDDIELPASEAIQELIMRVGMLRCLETLGLIDNEELIALKNSMRDAISACTKAIRKNGKKLDKVFVYEFG